LVLTKPTDNDNNNASPYLKYNNITTQAPAKNTNFLNTSEKSIEPAQTDPYNNNQNLDQEIEKTQKFEKKDINKTAQKRKNPSKDNKQTKRFKTDIRSCAFVKKNGQVCGETQESFQKRTGGKHKLMKFIVDPYDENKL